MRRRPLVDQGSVGINVRQMIARQHEEDILALGKMVEDLLSTPNGDVVYHTILNLRDLALRTSGNQDADRVIGELNGYDKVLEALERYILNARGLKEKRELDEEEKKAFAGMKEE